MIEIPDEWNRMTTDEIRKKHPLFLCRLLSTNASFRVTWRNKLFYECPFRFNCAEGYLNRKNCEKCDRKRRTSKNESES